METLLGYKIVQTRNIPPAKPRLALSAWAPVSDEYREKYNKWLVDMFGEDYVYYVNSDEHTMFMHPDLLNEIKKAMHNASIRNEVEVLNMLVGGRA